MISSLLLEQQRDEITRIQMDRRTEQVLQDDSLLQGILKFLPDTFRFTATVSKRFHRNYLAVHQSNRTAYHNAMETIEMVRLCLSEGGDAERIMQQRR